MIVITFPCKCLSHDKHNLAIKPFVAGYLHDHKIRDLTLLPRAAMFEMCNAASECLDDGTHLFVMHAINLLMPCHLKSLDGGLGHTPTILSCCANYILGQVEVKSIDKSGVLEVAKQVHLQGWCTMIQSHHFLPSGVNRMNQIGISSLSTSACLRPHRSNLSHLPSLSQWLHHTPTIDKTTIMTPSGFEHKPHGTTRRGVHKQAFPTCTAIVLDMPPASCLQPGGYAIHPARLDAATHTAAALALMPSEVNEKSEVFHHVKVHLLKLLTVVDLASVSIGLIYCIPNL